MGLILSTVRGIETVMFPFRRNGTHVLRFPFYHLHTTGVFPFHAVRVRCHSEFGPVRVNGPADFFR